MTTKQGFASVVRSTDELREMVGAPSRTAVEKEIAYLDDASRAFIAQSPFALIGTSAPDGTCDVSPKGDAPGFALILDEHTLVIPDRPGNRRADSMTNIIQNPHIGLLFLVPGAAETLRVNGRAEVIYDEDVLAQMEANGKRPKFGIAVHVEQAFLHCAKCINRSSLWNQDTWPSLSDVPSAADLMLGHVKYEGTPDEFQRAYDEGVRKLY